MAILGLAVSSTGCGRGQAPIPAGAQQVHVSVGETEVRLEPATVHAGDVYIVLDAPRTGSIVFVQRKRASADPPGPLSEEDLARLATGDTEGTAISGIDAGGCSAEQDAEDRGRMGPCGNVFSVTLGVGKYAIFGAAPDVDPASGRTAPTMAVLEVVP
jgi:hypothetical protein